MAAKEFTKNDVRQDGKDPFIDDNPAVSSSGGGGGGSGGGGSNLDKATEQVKY